MECGVEENGSRKLSLELETETSESETKTPESDFNTLPSKKKKIPESEHKNPRSQKPKTFVSETQTRARSADSSPLACYQFCCLPLAAQ